ncbi:DUF1559 domain-containing protein [bacterium]|nr:DUF1559 domain-containing protein [bacterium]
MPALRRLTLAVVAILVGAALLPAAQPPGVGPPAPAAPKALAAVPPNGFLVVSVDVAKLWDDPTLKPMQEWFAGQKEATLEPLIGVAPADLARVTVYLPDLGGGRDPGPVVLVTTRRPYNEARVVKNLAGDRHPDGRRVTRAGNILKLPPGGPFGVAVLGDERTLILLPDGGRDEGRTATVLAAQLLNRQADGALAPALAAAGTSTVSAGLDVRQLNRLFGHEGAGVAPYASALRATGAMLTADLEAGGLKTRLALTFPTPEDARRAGPVVEEALAELAASAAAEAKREAGRGEHGVLPGALFAAGAELFKSAKVEVKEATVVATGDKPGGEAIARLVAALPKQVAVARRNAEAQNNLKQVLLGLHNAHDTYGFFPGDVGPDRKTAWSWRVQILPFIEQDQLYRQLDMQLPWDNPRNKAILEKAEMPKVFEVPGRPAPKGHTYWRSFTLPKKTEPKGGRPWLAEGERGPSIATISDGTSNTFAVVEAGEAVPWYAPDVLAYDGKRPLPQLGEKDGPGFLAGMADGSVRFVRAKTDEATIRAAITRDGGEALTFPDR